MICIWSEPTLEDLLKIPTLYSVENTTINDIIIYEHFFIFNSDWYIAEFDPSSKLMYGYAILNGDYQNAEWGYVDFNELKQLNVKGFEIERDRYWLPKKAGLVDKINEGRDY